MRSFKHLSVAVVVLSSAFVLAQSAPRMADAADDNGDDNGDDVAPERYAGEADKALSQMRAALDKGLDEVKAARAEKDSVRLLCVNEPVAAMKGVVRVAENATSDLQEAIASKETAEAKRQFRKINQARQQVDQLLLKAQNCAGSSSTDSTTSVELEIDENLIAIDPYYGDESFFYDPSTVVADGTSDTPGETDGPTIRPPNASGIL
jgi:hypothetical protein